nr:MFS transporter [Kibdelosporangium sp. MJ126-NF4]CEL15949.1 putative transmembrane efflux protein [Kibdelosporangium sp. MJ126-NF4]CTQ93873.1 putative transmembrane efflux protein [Kibdelosporangium sp. MJ126-NF4]
MTKLFKRRADLVLVLLCLAQFMVILDTTIVNVALPSISADLGFGSDADLQYVISLYALTFGGVLILAGRVADLVGRRRVFAAGMLMFAAASLACGLASNPAVLLAARAAQGVASAMVSAAALALLTTLFTEGSARNRALGVWGAVGGAAGACGLLLGGVLTHALGWPWVFFINLPVGVMVAVAAPRLLPADRRGATTGGLDLPGAVTVTAGLALLIFGLTRGEQEGFLTPPVLSMLAAAIALLVAFIVIERHRRAPLVDFRIFRVPGIVAANTVAVLLTTIVASNLFFTTLSVQQILRFSPLETGLAFLPNSVLVIVGSAWGSRLVGRTGPGTVIAGGFAVLTIGSLLLTGISEAGHYVRDVLPGFALTGFGLGLAFVAITIAATRGIDGRDQGLASGLLNTAQQIGFGVGIAVVAAAAASYADSAHGGPGERLIAGYSAGYLIDAILAAVTAIMAVVLMHPPTRNQP